MTLEVVEIVSGVVLAIVAAVLVLYGLDSGRVLAAGVLVGGASAGLLYLGAHTAHVRDHAKHAAIARDLRDQGFRIPDDGIHALEGDKVVGPAVELALGACVYEFPLTKLNDVWYVTTARRDGNGYQKLTPSTLAGLARACP